IREINFISRLSGMKKLDRNDIVSILSYLISTKKMYNDVIVLDMKGTILYGYSQDIRGIYQSSNFEKSIATKSIEVMLKQEDKSYYVELYSPIVRDDGNVVGVIYIKIGLDEIADILRNKGQEDGIESYIVNKDGVMMTQSKNIPDAIGKVKMNLKKLRLNIDYSESNTYKDYSNNEVYGRYFDIKDTDWTLIVESDYTQNILKQEKSKVIGQITVALQGAFVFFIQIYVRKRFDIELSDNEIQGMINNTIHQDGEVDK
ncbi:MAG: cache domain-containing protein, partial [Clostridium sp.]